MAYMVNGGSITSDKSAIYQDDTLKPTPVTQCIYNTTGTSLIPKTIMINNYAQSRPPNHSAVALTQPAYNSSQFTIYTHNDDHATVNCDPTSPIKKTVVRDCISICINNHFRDPCDRSIDPPVTEHKIYETDDASDMAQETLITSIMAQLQNTFRIGDDVLVRMNDDRFYLGTIEGSSTFKYLIKFDDGTERCAIADDLKRIDRNRNSQPFCVVCKQTEILNPLDFCKQCSRGYHLNCMKWKDKKTWFCLRCSAQNQSSQSGIKQPNDKENHRFITTKSQLPYDFYSLTWVHKHKMNLENTYCYCGENGSYIDMLKCARCDQWFHPYCVKVLHPYPLFHGDRFFVFVCSMCNQGQEYLQRLQIDFADIVHLLMFNLSLKYLSLKYFNLVDQIIPYIQENWLKLQLGIELQSLSNNQIKENVVKALNRDNSGRFIYKTSDMSDWGLRYRIPPIAPDILLPNGPIISPEYLQEYFKHLPHIILLPISKTCQMASDSGPIENLINVDDNEDESNSPFTASTSVSRAATPSTGGGGSSGELDYRVDSSDPTTNREQSSIVPKSSQSKKRNRKRVRKSMDVSMMQSDSKVRVKLDTLIPCPGYFTGTYNPFIAYYKWNKEKSTVTTGSRLAMKKAQCLAEVRIVRTVKRRLSARDLLIGPNNEVKRRRINRRSSSNVEVISTAQIAQPVRSVAPLKLSNRRDSISTSRPTNIHLKPVPIESSTSAPTTPLDEISINNNSQPDDVPIIQTLSSSISSSASSSLQSLSSIYIPIRNRLLRKREPKNYSEVKVKPANQTANTDGNGSPMNQLAGEGDLSNGCVDLDNEKSLPKSKISMMTMGKTINGMTRIVNQSYRILGVHVNVDGQKEYLVEWG